MKYSTTRRLRKAGRILMITFAFITAAGFAAGSMLEANSGQVNSYLGTGTEETKNVGDYTTFPLDDEYTNSDGSTNTDAIVAAHRAMGIQLAEEGTVLLKNKDNALPLSTSSEKVTLMGYRSTASGALYGMTSGSPVESSQNVSFYDGLKEAGFDVNKSVADTYESVCSSSTYTGNNKPGGMGYYVTSTDGLEYTSTEPDLNDDILSVSGTSMTGYTDVAIVVIGRASSEQSEYFPGTEGASAESGQFSQSTSGNVLSLSDSERELIKDAKAACSKVVVVLTTTNAMEISELEEDDDIDAILLAGFPGNYGFIGVANILSGAANPSGRLSDTYASDTSASPAMQNSGLNLYTNYRGAQGSSGSYALATNDYYGGAYVVQAEGIYTGYKYYETRYEDTVLNQGNATSSKGVGAYNDTGAWNYTDEVTYSFGYGLSYTTFSQTIDKVTFTDDGTTAEVTVTVRNTGSVAGKSVVQVYGQSPYTTYDKTNKVEKASVQLLAYDKTDVIAAGSSVTLTITVDMQNLASYDYTNAKTYIMEQSDDYYFALGCNGVDNSEGAHAAINNILAAKGKTTADGMDVDGSASAAYKFSWALAEDTFATSKAGVEVTNQLENADLNYYISGKVTYLSRNHWDTTWPTSYSTGSVKASTTMVDYLTNAYYDVSTDDDVSDITFGATYSEEETAIFPDMLVSDGTGATVTSIDDSRWDTIVNQITLEDAIRYTASGNRVFEKLSSVHFLSLNSYTENGSVGIQKTLSQQSDKNSPYYVSSSDANADYSTNVFGSPTLMASTWNQDLMYEMGVLWGNDGIVENMPMVWAPSVNLHRTAYNGRNGEYYSEDGILSGYSALRLGQGALSKGLITAEKHFAFNTQETSRLGLSEFMNEQAARENELRAFQVAIEGDDYNDDGNTTGVIGIMTSYNRIGVTYSGGHTGLMQGILRGEWDFDGYATSDLPRNKSTYMPYIESMVAGTTNFDAVVSTDGTTIWGSTPAEIASTIANDATVLTNIKQNLKYSLWAFSQSNLANWLTSETEVVDSLNWWRLTYYACEIGGCAFVAGGLAMYVTAEVGDCVIRKREKKNKK